MTDHLIAQTEALAALAAADPATPIPTCPAWTLHDLLGHVGVSQRWATEVVTAGAQAPPAQAEPPEKVTAGWLVEGAHELSEAIETSPHPSVWTFLGPRPPAFWRRRILNDLVIHHADAALALDAPCEIPPEVAADTLAEGLDLIATGSRAGTTPDLAALRGNGETLLFATPDGPSWRIVREPEGVTWGTGGGRAADVTVTAPVDDLLLVFARRLPPERATLTGDRDLLDHWLRHTSFG